MAMRISLIILFCWCTLAAQTGAWESRAEMPTARKEISNAAVALDGRIYVVGGVNAEGEMVSTLEIYDPLQNTWSEAASLPIAVWRTSAAAHDGKLYTFGGYESLSGWPFSPTNRVFEYDPADDEWEEQTSMPTERGTSVAVAFDGVIHVFGGANSNGDLDVHEIYDPAADDWATGLPIPTARSGLAAAILGDSVYVMGGYILDPGVIPLDVVEIYEPLQPGWSDGVSMPIGRLGISAATVNDRIYVFGGQVDGAVPSRTLQFDPAASEWTQMADMPDPVSFMGIAAIEDTVYAIGGGEINLNPFDGLDVNHAFFAPGC